MEPVGSIPVLEYNWSLWFYFVTEENQGWVQPTELATWIVTSLSAILLWTFAQSLLHKIIKQNISVNSTQELNSTQSEQPKDNDSSYSEPSQHQREQGGYVSNCLFQSQRQKEALFCQICYPESTVKFYPITTFSFWKSRSCHCWRARSEWPKVLSGKIQAGY